MYPKKSAFTVAELLIVMAIIAVLAAVIYVVFGGAREKAREGVCISHLRQIGQAIAMYRSDFGSDIPNGGAKAMNVLQALGVPNLPRELVATGYIKKSETGIFRCPDDPSWLPPTNPHFIVSYTWCAGTHDVGRPGRPPRTTWRWYRERGERIAVSLDLNHWKYYRAAGKSDLEKVAGDMYWLILRLDGSVERKYQQLDIRGSCSL